MYLLVNASEGIFLRACPFDIAPQPGSLGEKGMATTTDYIVVKELPFESMLKKQPRK
jgi:hypothetical protein